MPIITLSRGFPAGCQAVAEAVAATLGCPCLGREILVEAATKLGVSEDLLSKRIEDTPSLWERLIRQRHDYVIALQAALAEHVASGDLVYHSYAGHLLLKELPCVLRVRIVAPLETRILEAMQRENLTRELAELSVRRYDEVRGRWTRTIYGVDWADPTLYGIVMSLENLSVAEASDCIVRLARHPRFAITEDFRKKLLDFRLVTRVRLALANSPATRDLALEVQARDGVVVVSGVPLEPSMPGTLPDLLRREVTSVVRSVEGVREVKLTTQPQAVFP
ncbi:MAG: cytidylate kinase family protein [Acidithiobacillales bacterium]